MGRTCCVQKLFMTFRTILVHMFCRCCELLKKIYLYSLPTFMKWKWEFEGDHLEAKQTELACNETFNTVYFVVLNALFRFLLPTICLVVFNVLIFREVSFFYTNISCTYNCKIEKILKGSLVPIPSHSPSVKFQIIGGNFV